MKTFKLRIKVIDYTPSFELKAESVEDAEKKALEMFQNSEIMVDEMVSEVKVYDSTTLEEI